jgi:hypothetical protein
MPTYYKRDTSGTTNWNLATSWSTVSSTSAVNTGTFPSSTTLDPVIFDASSSNVTVNVASICTSLDFTTYAATITMTNNLTVHGNITLGVSMGMTGAGFLSINASCTYTSNNVTWNGTIQFFPTTAITVTLASLITTVQNLRPSTNGTGVITINSNTLNILGDLTMLNHIAGSTQVNLTGTGTWNAQNTTNSEVRTKLNINTTGTITRGANGSAYAGLELKYTQGTLVNGTTNLQLSSNANTLSIISNGVNWGNVYLVNNTTTLTDDMTVNDFTYSFSNVVINGSNLRINGNLISTSSAIVTGTTVFQIIGTGNQTWTTPNAVNRIANSMNIDKASGTFTLSSANIAYGSATAVLTYTKGTFAPGTSTFITQAGVTFNITASGFSLNNWSPVAGTYTINTNPLIVNGTLLLAGTTTFAGTSGWTTTNFTHAGAATTCTLKSGNTYTVNGVLTMIGTAASRAILQSSDAVAVTASIASLSNQLVVTVGTPTPPAAGYVLGSTSTALPIALNNLLPDRPTIASGAASPYTLVSAIGVTALASGSYTLGKKAFLIVTNGTGSTNVAYVTTRDIDSNGGITILAFASYSDAIGQPSANIFRTLNWGPLIAPSGSVYYTFVN